ncbi:MAG: LCP family protein [Emergencia sp.]
MRSKKYRETCDFKGMKYSPELIRQLEDPEYARAAEEYERQARARKEKEARRASRHPEEQHIYTEEDLYEEIRRNRAMQKSEGKHSGGGRGGREKKKKYRWNKGKLLRNIFALLLILAVAGTGAFFALTRNFDKVDTGGSDFAIDSQVAEDLSGYRNIAILGSDARADEGYDGSRTDAIIIMSINRKNGDIRLISVMRDSYLRLEYLDGSLILDKITHAHHYGGGADTIAALNRSLDLNIEEFVIFNWTAVADAVDCLGGVEINVKDNEIWDMNHWGPETARNVGREYTEITGTGSQTLDGVQAVTYCRIRKNSGGDEGRSVRYKKIMTAVMKKALTQPWKIPELSKTVFPNIRTNMSQLDMLTAAVRAPGYDIKKSITWPENYYSGLLSDGISYVVPLTLESEVQDLHSKAFGQEGYQVSDTCAQISQDIIWDTGLQ